MLSFSVVPHVKPLLILSQLRGSQCKRFCLQLAFCLLWVTRAAAHDFWIEPESFQPKLGAKVPLRLHVGQDVMWSTLWFAPSVARPPGVNESSRSVHGYLATAAASCSVRPFGDCQGIDVASSQDCPPPYDPPVESRRFASIT